MSDITVTVVEQVTTAVTVGIQGPEGAQGPAGATGPAGTSGGGDVVGPASSTDNAIVRFDSTTGKLLQDSSVFIDDSGNLTVGVTAPTNSSQFQVTGNSQLSNTDNFRTVALTAGSLKIGNLLSTMLATDQAVTGLLRSAHFNTEVNYPSAPASTATNNALSASVVIPSTNTTSSSNISMNAFSPSAQAFKTSGDVGTIRAINAAARSDTSGTTSNIITQTSIATFAGAGGTLSGSLTGINGQAVVSSSATSSTTVNARGVQAFVGNYSATATITNVYGIDVTSFTNSGTFTNTYGVYVGDISAGTQTNPPYSFYASDTNAWNYFAGRVGIGNTVPDETLDVTGNGKFSGTLQLGSYTVATVPSAATSAKVIFVSDEAGGAVLAFSDGTDWRRVTDRAIIS